MENSILTSVKKTLGLPAEYDAFDEDVLMHVNTAFSTLTQLGVGPEEGFMIQGAEEEWSAFIGDDTQLNSVKTYVYLRVKNLFDPPSTSFVLTAQKEQIEALEWRLNAHREETEWVDPNPPAPVEEV